MGVREVHPEYGINAIIRSAVVEKRQLAESDIDGIKKLLTPNMKEVLRKLGKGEQDEAEDGREKGAIFCMAHPNDLADMFTQSLVNNVTFETGKPIVIKLTEAGKKVSESLAHDGEST